MRSSVESKHIIRWIAAVLMTTSAGLAAPALTQEDYPSGIVTIVVPFTAGGGADVIARTIAAELTEQTGQRFIVENRPGASAMVGSQFVALAPADGYTVLLVGPNHTTNPFLFDSIAYDAVEDFEPVSLLTSAPYNLVTSPDSGIDTLQDLIEMASAQPGELSYGSSGTGTAGQLGFELIKLLADIDLLHIPYSGSPPLLADLLGGQVLVGFVDPLSSAAFIADGRLHAIATSSVNRPPGLLEVPTVAESGLPDFDVVVWQGLLAPAGTPEEIVNKLNAVIQDALDSPGLQEQLGALGVQTAGGSPDEFAEFIAQDLEKWDYVISTGGITLD